MINSTDDDNKTLQTNREKIEFALSDFLTSEDKAICLSGTWGCGKTYLWKEFIYGDKDKCLKHYSYVSLFGVDSIKDAKYAIVANKISKNEITENGHDNIFSLKKVHSFSLFIFGIFISLITSWLSYKWFTFEFFSYNNLYLFIILFVSICFISILNKNLLHLISINKISIFGFHIDISPNEQQFMSIKDTLICIDDLERKGKNLSIKDIFGLLSFLKESHNCKVIFICNSDCLSDDDKRDFDTQKDKLFDYHLEFEPTVDDLIEIAYKNSTFLDNHKEILEKYIKKLEIKNIRILQKIKRNYELFEKFFVENNQYNNSIHQEENPLYKLIKNVVLFTYCDNCSNDNNSIPNLDFFLSLNIMNPKEYSKWIKDNNKSKIDFLNLYYKEIDYLLLSSQLIILAKIIKRGYIIEDLVYKNGFLLINQID